MGGVGGAGTPPGGKTPPRGQGHPPRGIWGALRVQWCLGGGLGVSGGEGKTLVVGGGVGAAPHGGGGPGGLIWGAPPSSYGPDDDIVFEDFARLRLKGLKEEKEEEEQLC